MSELHDLTSWPSDSVKRQAMSVEKSARSVAAAKTIDHGTP